MSAVCHELRWHARTQRLYPDEMLSPKHVWRAARWYEMLFLDGNDVDVHDAGSVDDDKVIAGDDDGVYDDDDDDDDGRRDRNKRVVAVEVQVFDLTGDNDPADTSDGDESVRLWEGSFDLLSQAGASDPVAAIRAAPITSYTAPATTYAASAAISGASAWAKLIAARECCQPGSLRCYGCCFSCFCVYFPYASADPSIII